MTSSPAFPSGSHRSGVAGVPWAVVRGATSRDEAQEHTPARTKRLVSSTWLREPAAVFASSLLLYSWIGWLGAYVIQTYTADGLARTGQAFAVLFGRDPHLAAIGFIWGPLTVLTIIPLMALLAPLGWSLLAGPLASALYGALALALLTLILRDCGLPPAWRITWLALTGAHPLIVQNAVQGLSEAAFLACLLLSFYGFVLWQRHRQLLALLIAGAGVGISLWCRYDGLAWLAAGTLVLAGWYVLQRPARWRSIAEASVLTFIMPAVWALGLWMLVNWQIMGNPIFFLVGPGSTATTPDTARYLGAAHPFAAAHGSLAGALALLARQIIDVGPLLVPATVLSLIVAAWRRRGADLVSLILAWSILGFTTFTAFQGLLPPFSRYFFWIVPAGVIAAATLHSAVPTAWLRHAWAFCVAALLLLGDTRLAVRAWPILPEPPLLRTISVLLHPPEVTDVRDVRGQLDEYRTIAATLDGQPAGTRTLIDAASGGSNLILLVRRPHDIVTTTDRRFFTILREPAGTVDQILVPRPTIDAMGRSEVLRSYPRLYEDGAAWATLVQEIPGGRDWRLYAIAPPAGAALNAAASGDAARPLSPGSGR